MGDEHAHGQGQGKEHDHGDGHDHPHDHGHAQGVGHSHVPTHFGRAFFIGITLNLIFVMIEFVYGYLSASMALVSDAAHNLGDVLGLALAWGAIVLAKRTPTSRRTYGFRKSTVLAALANAVLLLVAVGGVAWEAVLRLRHPAAVNGRVVMAVAAAGVVVNGVSALLFVKGSKDANIRGAFLHLAADAGVSLGVVAAGFVILQTGWVWIDPAVSLVVSAVILLGTWGLLRQAVDLSLDAVPDGIDPDAVKAYLHGLPGVLEIHDLHIWAMSTTETALTAHVVMAPGDCHERFLADVAHELEARFAIAHMTVQVEPPAGTGECRLAAPGVI